MQKNAQTPARVRVGFDLGGTKMRVGVYDDAFRQVGMASKRHPKRMQSSAEGVQTVIGLIAEALGSVAPSTGAAPLPASIGMACPGPVNPATGQIYELTNLGWNQFSIRAPLAKRFNCPVFVLNDVDAGTFGEFRFGAGRKAECVLGVFPGTGVGGGCVRGGHLMQAASVSCFEIGHLPVMPAGPLCGCGQRGCLETLAGRLGIAQAAAAAAFRGEAPHLLKAVGVDLKDIRSGTLAKAIAAGDRVIEDIVREAARWLGVGIAGVVNLLAPDVIVLGGGLVEAMPELYLEEVGQTVQQRVMRAYRKHFKVVAAQLGDDAVIQGAAAWAATQGEKTA